MVKNLMLPRRRRELIENRDAEHQTGNSSEHRYNDHREDDEQLLPAREHVIGDSVADERTVRGGFLGLGEGFLR